MKKRLSAFLVAAAVMSASPVSAYELEEVLKNLERAQNALAHVQFDFLQEVEFVGGDMSAKVSGTALLAKPDKIRLSKMEPQEQLTVSDGRKVWIYTPAYKQVWVGNRREWEQGSQALPQGMLRLDDYVETLRKNYNLTMSAQNIDGGILLNAVAKDRSLAHEMDLQISTETWLPSRTVYRSESARVVTTLSNMAINPRVEASAFSFDPPKGTDVIPLN